MRHRHPNSLICPPSVEGSCRSFRSGAFRSRVVLSLCVAAITTTVAAQPERRVTARVAGQTLAEALIGLGRSAGTELRSGPNAAGTRWFLFLRDEPLAAVRRQLEQFIPVPPGTASWYAQGSVQILDEDLASRNARLNAAVRRRKFAVEHRRRGAEDAATRARSVVGSVDPRRTPTWMPFALVLAGLPPAAREAAYAGQTVNVPFGYLSAAGQQTVQRKVAGFRAGVTGYPDASFDGEKQFREVVVEVRPAGTPTRPGLRVWLRGGRSQNGPMFPDVVNAPNWTGRDGQGGDALYDSYWKRPRRPERAIKSPHLQKRISLEGRRGWTIETMLEELSRASGLPVLGEYDPCRLPGDAGLCTLDQDRTIVLRVWQMLDLIAEQFDLDWDIRDRWILIRSPRTVLGWSGELDLSPPQRPAANAAPARP